MSQAAEDGAPHGGPTGHREVDAVLASLARLEETPTAEQVALYESAHDRLRAALTDPEGQSGEAAPRAGQTPPGPRG